MAHKRQTLFVRRFAREVRAPFPPAWVVRVLIAPLAALARRRGYGERYAPAAEVVALHPRVASEARAAA